MKKTLRPLTSLLLLGFCLAAPAHAQYYGGLVNAGVGLGGAIAEQNRINKRIAARTTTTHTYRGESFLMKRTPDDLLAGEATDRIVQLETQLNLCHTALLADSLGITCPPERQAIIREGIRHIAQVRPNWDQKAYWQEFKLYLAEDKRRRHAAK